MLNQWRQFTQHIRVVVVCSAFVLAGSAIGKAQAQSLDGNEREVFIGATQEGPEQPKRLKKTTARSAHEMYDAAVDEFKRGHLTLARWTLEELIKQFPDSRIAMIARGDVEKLKFAEQRQRWRIEQRGRRWARRGTNGDTEDSLSAGVVPTETAGVYGPFPDDTAQNSRRSTNVRANTKRSISIWIEGRNLKRDHGEVNALNVTTNRVRSSSSDNSPSDDTLDVVTSNTGSLTPESQEITVVKVIRAPRSRDVREAPDLSLIHI